jgi:hypothetical protein
MTYHDFFLARGKKIRLSNPSRWLLLIGLLFSKSEAQNYNHSYPRTGVQHFGSAPADWYARFELAILPRHDAKEARDIKAINPNTIVLYTDGWTAYSRNWSLEPLPSEFLARDSKGNKVELNWGAQLIDMSILCPKVNGKAYWETHPEYLVSVTDLTAFDGIASDWCWGKPSGVKDIDLDRNGKNDYDEHGENWVNDKWLQGVTAFISRLRQLIGPNKLIWINSGQFHDWAWNNTNGVMLEKEPGVYRWDWYWQKYQDFMANARQPHILFMDARPIDGDPNNTSDTKNNFRLMRFLLGVTTMGDGYFNFNPLEAGEHHYQTYYDEFDLNLGYPTGSAEMLSNGCYARFFDFGAIIVNPTGSSKTVSDNDLRSLAKYDGPYYRFKGNQDPSFNNGSQFTSVSLYGGEKSTGGAALLTFGDAIFLLKQPRAVVADVMIDNAAYGTTPSQEPATFVGGWQQANVGGDFYSQKERPSEGWFPHAYIGGGDGNATATFTPNLAVAGNYEVFEWHGYVDRSLMATNVPLTIIFGNGQTASKIVDQSKNQGRWNSLGTYSFPTGRSGKVVISNRANGIVVADVMMFVHRSSDANADVTPPAPPTGVKVSN